jgi:hypothetical protein
MTGGIDIDQFPAVELAVTGQPEGLLSLYVEQLRYASRHMGCIYEQDGDPIALDDFLDPDGTRPWVIFNNVFQSSGSVVQDQPFGFSLTGAGSGSATYAPADFDPIDHQHYVRRTKANKALAWLANDPLAKLHLLMDAELGRMWLYEGPGGNIATPATPGLGTKKGRADAWVADCMAHAYAIADDAWRARTAAWFSAFCAELRAAQMPNQLFSCTDDGKTAEDPPYGDGQDASYWVFHANEEIYLMLALLGIQESVGIDNRAAIRACGEGLWSFAWKVGSDGPLDRYPAGPLVGPRYATRAEIPAGLTDTVPEDPYEIGTALGMAALQGANMIPPTLAYTGAQDLAGALAQFESWGVKNLANRANSLAVLQQALGVR